MTVSEISSDSIQTLNYPLAMEKLTNLNGILRQIGNQKLNEEQKPQFSEAVDKALSTYSLFYDRLKELDEKQGKLNSESELSQLNEVVTQLNQIKGLLDTILSR